MTSSHLTAIASDADMLERARRVPLIARYEWVTGLLAQGGRVVDLTNDAGARARWDEAQAGSVVELVPRDLADWRPEHPADLVVCLDEGLALDVLPSLDDVRRGLAVGGLLALALGDEAPVELLASAFAEIVVLEQSEAVVSTIALPASEPARPEPDATRASSVLVVCGESAFARVDRRAIAVSMQVPRLGSELDGVLSARDRVQRDAERAKLQERRAASERDRIAESLVDAEQELAAIGRLERELDEQRALLASMQTTLSWRITAPLRWLRRAFGGS